MDQKHFRKTEYEIDEEVDRCFYIAGWILLLIFATVLALYRLGILGTIVHPCIFHTTTGFYCPGCGGSRAIIELFRGHILRSIYYHPVVFFTTVHGFLFMGSHTIHILSSGKWKKVLHFRPVYIWWILGITCANFLIKNLLLFFLGIQMR